MSVSIELYLYNKRIKAVIVCLTRVHYSINGELLGSIGKMNGPTIFLKFL